MLRYFRVTLILSLCVLVVASSSNSLEFQTGKFSPSLSTYVTPSELELFRHSLEFVKGASCRRDLNATLWGLSNNIQWAVSMYDASVRNPVGIGSSVLYQFGHFDQCLKSHLAAPSQARDTPHPVKAQYCLVEVTISGISTVESTTSDSIETLTSHWGECVPAVCSGDDVAIYLQHTLQRNVTVNGKMCQLNGQHNRPITSGMLIYALIISFFLLLTILSTGYHVHLIKSAREEDNISKAVKHNKVLNIALLSFSLIENTKKLFQASRDQQGLNPINGIKAWAMLFILCGHAATFMFGIPAYNVDFFTENLKTPIFGYVTNSLLFVDVFLMLSGYLLFRILFAELERRRGKLNPLILYIGRYIRLTPAYLVVIGFYMTWFTSLGSGPLWQQRIEREQDSCRSSWWLNLLYINNYFSTDKLCMFQSWYLSTDTQLFFVASIVIYLMYKSRKLGLHLLVVLVAGTSLVPFIITYLQELPPTFMLNSKRAEYIPGSDYFRNIYIKTHMRASAYFIGLLTGYVAHQMQTKSTKIPKSLLRLLWICSCILGAGALYSLFRFYADPYTNIESTLYAGFHRLAWNISIAFLILAVTTGQGGWLQRFLSLRVFVPFSRLTYCAYLVNGLVELIHTSSIRSPEYMNYIQTGNYMLGHSADTFLVAFVICLIFESPIHALERILMRIFSNGDRTKASSQNSSDGSPSTSEEQVA